VDQATQACRGASLNRNCAKAGIAKSARNAAAFHARHAKGLRQPRAMGGARRGGAHTGPVGIAHLSWKLTTV
jgi:hypothetical protein